MPIGKLGFAQLMDFPPLHTFRRCVARYPPCHPTKTFSHLEQFPCMAFAQLTFCESPRDIEVCLRAHQAKLTHLGIRGHVARSNISDANEKRDWRIYRDFANALIAEARRLYANDAVCVDLDNTVYALDTTTIDVSLKVFPWARFRPTRALALHVELGDRKGIAQIQGGSACHTRKSRATFLRTCSLSLFTMKKMPNASASSATISSFRR